jgi:UDP-N-acetylglucosamine 2-epimerase (non-hydrolysing)
MRRGAVAVIFGTRPELVKLAPVLVALGDAATVVHTGQHHTGVLAPVRADLGLPEPTVALTYPTGPPPGQVAGTVRALVATLRDLDPAAVVVHGDTNSTAAGALAAVAAERPLVHVEAGLRAYDRDLPEEHNRILVDHLADRLCAPTDAARGHLLAEGVAGERIAVTGNTVVDAAIAALPEPADRARLVAGFGLAAGGFVLATFHRQENVDDPQRLAAILGALDAIAAPVVFPVHPRTRDRMERNGIAAPGGHVHLVDPVGYREFLALEAECSLMVTDSGGVVEEATVVHRPVVVVRRSTERPEVIGTFAHLVPEPGAVAAAANAALRDATTRHAARARLASPYGTGDAGVRCAAVIRALVEG